MENLTQSIYVSVEAQQRLDRSCLHSLDIAVLAVNKRTCFVGMISLLIYAGYVAPISLTSQGRAPSS